jgi:hypothetical protein
MVSIATTEEIKEIISLAKQYEGGFSQHVKVNVDHATKAYLHMVETGLAIVFALKNGTGIIGGLAALKYPDINSGIMTAVECFWFVNPDQRGEGMKLLDSFEKWGSNNNCQRLALIHLEDSYPDVLQRIYKRKGYRLTESHYVKELI